MNIFAVREHADVELASKTGFSELPLPSGVEMPPPAKIKVIGVGGGGSNAVNRMIENGLSGVQFVAVNTDVQDLYNKSRAKIRMPIGKNLTGGKGAGGKPDVGESAAKEDLDHLRDLVKDTDMVFVTAGMGGGTGTGAAPVIAKLAKDQGALTVGVVTRPFDFEGDRKKELAEEGIRKMRASVDTLVVIPNQQLFKVADRRTTVTQAYRMADDVLRQGVQGITDLIVCTGEINVDFADVEATMRGQGDALMGIGVKDGDSRAKEAAEEAISNPLLEDTSIEGATRLLVNIAGSEEIAIVEVTEIMNLIRAKADPQVEIIHGITIDPELGDNVKVTVIATGFQGKAAAGQTETFRKDPMRGRVISAENYDVMRGLGNKAKSQRSDGNYLGISSSRSFTIAEDLSIPAYLRRCDPETEGIMEDDQAGRFAAGEKGA